MSDLKASLANKAQGNDKPKQKTLQGLIQQMEGQIKRALPQTITPERFTRIVLTALSTNPKLKECTQESFLGAMMNAAQLGLEPNTPLGQAYLIPYGNQCQFQIGYKGLIDLAHRSGEFKQIYAEAVYENDDFDYELGLEPQIKHKPAIRDRGDAIFYYAVYRLKNDGYGFKVMSKEDIENHRKQYSKAKNSPWNTNFDEMAKKTVLKQVLKYAPIKVDFVRQINEDETIKSKIEDDMSLVENEIIDITPSAEEQEAEEVATYEVNSETGEVLFAE